MKKIFYCLFVFLSACSTFSPSSRIDQTLSEMNKAYRTKEIDVFMSFVDDAFQGDKEELRLAVENDFAGFLSVEYSTTVFETKFDETTGVYKSFVSFLRTAKSQRLAVDNYAGEIVLTFKKEDDGFKLLSMPKPFLYGLITP